jgi:nucleoside-diphosphate-sugar epimerase
MDKVNLKNKRILVTGGYGYLGKKLIIELLSREAIVYAIDIIDEEKTIDNFYYKKIDLLNQKELNAFIKFSKPNIVYHLAATLNRSRDFSQANSIFDVNLKGTLNLLNSLKEFDYENFIFTSTSEVYGGELAKAPFKEHTNLVPASPYSLSKYCAEMSLKTFSNIYNKKFTILRLFNFYSSDMSKNFFLPSLIDKLKRNEDFDMTHGEQIRDYIHIKDIISALIISASKNATNEVFNVCGGVGKSIKEIALEIKEHLNSASKINFGAIPYRENEVWNMTGDYQRIKEALNWSPKFELTEDIRR